MSRLELVTECEHGESGPHQTVLLSGAEGPPCTEGSRIPLDPDRKLWFDITVTVQDVLDALEEA